MTIAVSAAFILVAETILVVAVTSLLSIYRYRLGAILHTHDYIDGKCVGLPAATIPAYVRILDAALGSTRAFKII
jgi:hypothetical protein